jgi:hypothetical protein
MTPRSVFPILVTLLVSLPSASRAQDKVNAPERTGEAAGVLAESFARPRQSWEALASPAFRTASGVVPLGARVVVEAHYFGMLEGESQTHVVQTGVSWHLNIGSLGFVAPGVGWYSGVDHGAVSGSVRWQIEHGRIVSEGLMVQAIDRKDGTERGQFWDGNHVSLSLLDRRVEVGPSWEHIHFREEDEWKWGGRVAVRLARSVTAQLFTLAPGRTEWRAGLLVR